MDATPYIDIPVWVRPSAIFDPSDPLPGPPTQRVKRVRFNRIAARYEIGTDAPVYQCSECYKPFVFHGNHKIFAHRCTGEL